MGKASPQAIALVRDFKRRAEKKYHLKKVVLFGSQVEGTMREGSDIDILVITDTFLSRPEFMSALLAEWHLIQKKKEPVDFLPFTEKEYKESSGKITIVKQAMEEGIEI